MRFLKHALVTICCVLALGCYEVNEEITINDDGSGVYNTKMDMGQLLELMQTFAGEEELAKEGLDKVLDTSFLLGSVLDSAENVTPEQKELLKNAKLGLKMNMKEKIFKIDMNVPYNSFSNLEQLLAGGGSGAGAISQAFKEVFKKPGDSTSVQQPADPGGMDDISGIYDVSVKKGLISRTVNEEKAKALLEKPEMAQLKQLGSSGMEILYTTTIRLPRPVKKADNPVIKLSDDKKTITMKYNLLEMIENPTKFSYTIEY